MPNRSRIYLDNAATSWPKPPEVGRAVYQYITDCGVAAGRSVYREAMEVDKLATNCRTKLAHFVGVSDPNRVLFTANGTDSLNLILHGLLRSGDHVVTTVTEHNSVLRPLSFLERHLGVRITRIGCDSVGQVAVSDLQRAIEPSTKVVIVNHASNVTGTLQPLEDIGRVVRQSSALFAVDAAQSLGHIPIDMTGCHIDLIAASAHKGLLGPLGLGIVLLGPKVETQLEPVRQGGTGTHSDNLQQPESLPEKYESGNLNVPAIVGLDAALDYLADRGLDRLRAHEVELTQLLLDGLSAIQGVTLYGPADPLRRVGVVSLQLLNFDPQEAAALLDSGYSIQVRSGLHCAPLMHESLGSLSSGGTVRFSFGPFTTRDEVQVAIRAIAEMSAEMPAG